MAINNQTNIVLSTDFPLFIKCGHLTTSANRQIVFLNCLFCSTSCLSQDTFLQHLELRHMQNSNVNNIVSVKSSCLVGMSEQYEMLPPLKPVFVKVLTSNINLNEERQNKRLWKYDEIFGQGNRAEMENLMPMSNSLCSEVFYENSKVTNMKVDYNNYVIDCLLDLYKQNDKLWNPANKLYHRNPSIALFNELSMPLFKMTKVWLSGLDIFRILNDMLSRYKRELTKFQRYNGKYCPQLWYFDKLRFLQKATDEKRKRKNTNNKVIEKNEKSRLLFRQINSFIISQYKRNECLWNPKATNFKCQNDIIFQGISICIQSQFKVSTDKYKVQSEIKKLRQRYRRELLAIHKCDGLYIPRLWCFKELDFLRPTMEENILHKLKKITKNANISRNKVTPLITKEINFPQLELQLTFIDIYRKYNCLWDVDHPDYRSAKYRYKALKLMFEELNLLMQPHKVTMQEMENTLHQIHSNFSIEKLNRMCGTNTKLPPTRSMPLLVYEKLSSFLLSNIGPFRCSICNTLCKTNDMYKMHQSKHDGKSPFICTICGRGFRLAGNLATHIRRHRHDLPYSCKVCRKKFATSTEVKIHMRSHIGEISYKCTYCDQIFKTWPLYNIHTKTHVYQSDFRTRIPNMNARDSRTGKYQCEYCGKVYSTHGYFNKHIKLHAIV